MIRTLCWVPALLVLAACGAQAAPGPGAVEKTVRDYVALRNNGDLRGMLGKSCGGLYTSTSNLLAQSPDRQGEITALMRDHPVDVESVVVNISGDHVFATTMTGSARTARGRETASQHGEVRQYQDGYRVCEMKP
ncbi:hypothetical protein VA596_04475 [Amycolatopsis sp., V23-08]|uniref:Nuclear transport factor 2 family protein n=1 Tax=Amycolatopsis heterodermiae TaxID=3110235 RepID=A0ABU5QZ40_9PSEU|nr:hypothetical protein [Amycolatopsis sp., V23-08]MEA5358780.1 hypothetical protein [Amycolatopsis sp., V23-08]